MGGLLIVYLILYHQITQNEAKGGVLRLVVAGGRAQEKPGASGAVAVGVRTLSEGGAVGGFSREQVNFGAFSPWVLNSFVFFVTQPNWQFPLPECLIL